MRYFQPIRARLSHNPLSRKTLPPVFQKICFSSPLNIFIDIFIEAPEAKTRRDIERPGPKIQNPFRSKRREQQRLNSISKEWNLKCLNLYRLYDFFVFVWKFIQNSIKQKEETGSSSSIFASSVRSKGVP